MGRDVVLKVQHDDMRCLMDSDVRNLGRLAAFVRDSMPFNAAPVRSPAAASCVISCDVARDSDWGDALSTCKPLASEHHPSSVFDKSAEHEMAHFCMLHRFWRR